MSSPVDLRVEYESALARHGYHADDSQRRAVERLDDLGRRLRAAQSRPAGILARLLGRGAAPGAAGPGERGLYLWGGVGRGKTFLMDLFHQHCGVPARREHFHRLMKDVHARLRELRDVAGPLDRVAADIARSTRVLCIDEMFVSDIADAMLLAGLFQGLLRNGVTLVFTSNLPPSELYRDGLQRQRFLPAIGLIEQHCEQLELDAGEDYRLRLLARAPLYLDARAAGVERQLAARFEDLCGESPRGGGIVEIEGRPIACVARADEAIWFAFEAICEGPRSQADYVEISRDYHAVIVSGVPRMDHTADNAARRFIALVDEFYDRGVKLVLSAHAGVDELYVGERLQFEFARTRSRLAEMQTRDYLARPHRA
jgi:cell division protein ZapE